MPPEVVPSWESKSPEKPFLWFSELSFETEASRVSAPMMLHRTDLYSSLWWSSNGSKKKGLLWYSREKSSTPAFDKPQVCQSLQVVAHVDSPAPALNLCLWWSLDTQNKESSDVPVPGPQLQSLTNFWASRMRSEPSCSIWWTSGTQKDGLGVLEMGL